MSQLTILRLRGTVKVSVAAAATEEDTRLDTVKKEPVYSLTVVAGITAIASTELCELTGLCGM